MAAATMRRDEVKEQGTDSKATPEKARVQFDFSRESLAKLDELVKTTRAHTRAEVIRKALTLLNEVLDAEQRGAKLMLKEPDGTLIQIITLL